ncbi:MAG TPA: protein kinase [Blastocatellia bacterium]|nr:protein kinase [Blastocatellia bacterium]
MLNATGARTRYFNLRSISIQHMESVEEGYANTLLGKSFGPYKVISHLGSGGMGVVYLAEDSRLSRKVALKLLPALYTRDEQQLRRFRQETRAASALNHPNIITIFEIGEADGIHFIAEEYIQGETLRERLSNRKVTTAETNERHKRYSHHSPDIGRFLGDYIFARRQ